MIRIVSVIYNLSILSKKYINIKMLLLECFLTKFDGIKILPLWLPLTFQNSLKSLIECASSESDK